MHTFQHDDGEPTRAQLSTLAKWRGQHATNQLARPILCCQWLSDLSTIKATRHYYTLQNLVVLVTPAFERARSCKGINSAGVSTLMLCPALPVTGTGYAGLDVVCRSLLKAGSPAFLCAKVAADTLLFGPIYILAFYAYGCYVIDGTGWQGFTHQVRDS